MQEIEAYLSDHSGEIAAEILGDPGVVDAEILDEAGEASANLVKDDTVVEAQCGCDSRTTALWASDGVLYDGNSQPIFVTE